MKKARIIIKSYLGIIFCNMSKHASLGQKRDCIVQRLMGVFLFYYFLLQPLSFGN